LGSSFSLLQRKAAGRGLAFNGGMTEWLGAGLQNQSPRFESGYCLCTGRRTSFIGHQQAKPCIARSDRRATGNASTSVLKRLSFRGQDTSLLRRRRRFESVRAHAAGRRSSVIANCNC
jgi:hypothetical protein